MSLLKFIKYEVPTKRKRKCFPIFESTNPIPIILSLYNTPETNRRRNLLPMDGEVYFVPDLFNPEQSTNYFNALMEKADWQQKQVEMYGKKLNVPRLTAWYGPSNKPYIYSGIKNEPTPWLPELLEIKKKVDEATGLCFTSVLLNLYRDGKDSVAWHRDNEHVLGKNPAIASVSFGATRLFKLRHFEDKKLVRNFALSPGSFLLMAGETQHKWEHAVPKTAKKIGPRINLTFRVI